MLSFCQIATLTPIACTAIVIALAIHETRQQFRMSVADRTIAAADAQTAQWIKLNQAVAEDETVIEPPLGDLPNCLIDDAPLPFEQRDRSELQALMILKAISQWLDEEAHQFGPEGEVAIRQTAQALRTGGLNVLEPTNDA